MIGRIVTFESFDWLPTEIVGNLEKKISVRAGTVLALGQEGNKDEIYNTFIIEMHDGTIRVAPVTACIFEKTTKYYTDAIHQINAQRR